MKSLAITLGFFALLGAGHAFAGMIFLQAPPSGNTNLIPVNTVPYTYPLGFDPVTGVVQGVCGYRMRVSSGRGGNHPVHDLCSWDLQGNSLGLAGDAFPLPPVVYGPVQYFYDPITGGNVPVFVIATDDAGNVLGIIDEYPQVSVLIVP